MTSGGSRRAAKRLFAVLFEAQSVRLAAEAAAAEAARNDPGVQERARRLQAERDYRASAEKKRMEAEAHESALAEFHRTGIAPSGYKACRYCGKLNVASAQWCTGRHDRGF